MSAKVHYQRSIERIESNLKHFIFVLTTVHNPVTNWYEVSANGHLTLLYDPMGPTDDSFWFDDPPDIMEAIFDYNEINGKYTAKRLKVS